VLAFCPKRLSCSPEECCFVNCSGCGYERAPTSWSSVACGAKAVVNASAESKGTEYPAGSFHCPGGCYQLPGGPNLPDTSQPPAERVRRTCRPSGGPMGGTGCNFISSLDRFFSSRQWARDFLREPTTHHGTLLYDEARGQRHWAGPEHFKIDRVGAWRSIGIGS
jgi:hypothetical protein